MAGSREMPVLAQEKKPNETVGTVSQFLVKQLAAWGVRRIYGVIGDANLMLLDELSKQSDIRYVACRHECGAALMASAEAKLTGRPGVCLATSGPGIANLLNGLADAHADGAGVFALTGQVETGKIGTHTKQYVDQQQLMIPVADLSRLLADPAALPQLMKELWFQSRYNGKVTHLSIPKNLYSHPVIGSIAYDQPHYRQPLSVPNQWLEVLAERLSRAQRPVFIAGLGVKNVRKEFTDLSEMLGAAVITTMPGKSAFPNRHPLYAGGFGQGGSEASSRLLAECDLVVIFGSTWWPENYVPHGKPVVQIDLNPAHIGRNHPVQLGIVGDLEDILPRLLRLMESKDGNRSGWVGRIREVREQWAMRLYEEIHDANVPMAPQTVMHILSEAVAKDAVITLDTGDHTLWFNRVFQAENQDILLSGRWRTLGFALPAAVAAQFAYPFRQVVAVAGDGGAVQTLMELLTAVEYRLPIKVIVMSNRAYAMEKNRMISEGLSTMGSTFLGPDFAAVARACGALGWTASSVEEFRKCLSQALQADGAALIEARVADTAVPHTKI